MSQQDNNFTVWGFIKGFGKLVIGFLLVLQGIIGLVVMLMIVGAIVAFSNNLAGDDDGVTASVPQDAALLINPNGVLVEQAETVDPFEFALQEAYGVDEPTQVAVHDLVRAIRSAADDDRIKGIVLDLSNLWISSGDASKAHYLAAELEAFKGSGKTVVAVGDYYGQEQYLVASRADTIYLHDRGTLFFAGYAQYNTYLKSFLDKLLITPHVFRVGTFKAAVEPLLRDDMSDEARQANTAYLSTLWAQFGESVEAARELAPGEVARYADDFNAILETAGGDFAQAALDHGLVDELVSRADRESALVRAFGEDRAGESYKKVGFRRYLAGVARDDDGAAPNVGVVTVAGAIVDGEAPAGVAAGGDTIAGYLREAREDDNVKAVVLRIDSPGGSAFASEIIRDEILALKAAGKPVVASMGSYAASGGYWVASPADEIWAAPTTITGSIGIFSFLLTYEKAAEYWGVNVDGVGTTALSSIYKTGLGPLEPNVADVLQQGVEHGYEEFLSIVAEGRGLDRDYVDSVGQGRVWIGARAQQLRLVDQMGPVDEAVAAAARLAGLEEYDRVEIIEEVNPLDRILSNLAVEATALAGLEKRPAGPGRKLIAGIVDAVEDKAAFVAEFNDPQGVYARCLTCGK